MFKCPACKKSSISLEQKFHGVFYNRDIICPECHSYSSCKFTRGLALIAIVTIGLIDYIFHNMDEIIVKYSIVK